MAQGAAQAAKQAGKPVFTIGLDGNPDALADVQSGSLTATLVVFPREMGARTIETIEKRLKGEKVGLIEKIETEVADKGNVSKFVK
jgi:ribose transport system substrate-binding protein